MSTSLRGIAVGDAEARLSEEPGAGKPHAGICAGGRGVTPFPTATAFTKQSFRVIRVQTQKNIDKLEVI